MEFPHAHESINPLQLAELISSSLSRPVTCDAHLDTVIVYEDVTGVETQVQAVIDSYVFDPDYMPPGPEKAWRDTLRAEVAFIDDQIATWPPDATTNAQALQRVNFLLAATKRVARNQSRIMKFIDNATMDSD